MHAAEDAATVSMCLVSNLRLYVTLPYSTAPLRALYICVDARACAYVCVSFVQVNCAADHSAGSIVGFVLSALTCI